MCKRSSNDFTIRSLKYKGIWIDVVFLYFNDAENISTEMNHFYGEILKEITNPEV